MNSRLLPFLSVLILFILCPVSAKQEVPRLPDPATPDAGRLDNALRLGVDFLLKNQNPDGSWGRYVNSLSDPVLCPVPSGPLAFRMGTTAIDIMALLAVSPDDPSIRESTDKATEWMLRELPSLRRPSTSVLYNVWGYAYALQALSAMASVHQDDPARLARYREAARQQVDRLTTFSNLKGGWGYYEFNDATARPSCFSMSFTTAAVLTALKDAENHLNIKLDNNVCRKAASLLKRLRTPEGTYMYGDYMKGRSEAAPYNRHMGSLGRTVAANYALAAYGDPIATPRDIEDSLDWMWARNGWFLLAKKWPIPHESFAKNAGYFVFFGYYYAGKSLEKLPASQQNRHAALLANIILPQQEPAGCWWDFPMMDYHRQYGTGFALLALAQARAHLQSK